MGCCGEREKFGDVQAEQKWDFVNLDDFKSTSCWTPFAYGYLWVMLAVSISVYAVDTFTAINLLAFNRWAGQIKPSIPFTVSRWIFAGCIILSFVLLIYRWWRAIRVIKQGGVAKSYLDPLAVRLQSMRAGEGRGWKRFLVFAELTKSRKGADYVALFSYFSFEAWLRICFAEGPRQVVNAITLYSVARLDIIPVGQHAAEKGQSPIAQFFINIGLMAEDDKLQVVVLFGMLWTFVIWLLAAISLAVSIILYLLFLWHHIPSGSGGLTGYCRTKINRRMQRIVRVKVDKALKKENEIRAREEAKAARDGLTVKKQPTLPDLAKAPTDALPPLSRTTTQTTLPEYSSRPGSSERVNAYVPPMPDLKNGRPGPPQRNMTHGSVTSTSSFGSNAPLMGAAGEMGYADGTPTPGSGPFRGPPPPGRNFTGPPAPGYPPRAFSPGPPRPGTAQGRPNGPGSYPMQPLNGPGPGMGPRRTSDNDSFMSLGADRSMGTRTPSLEHSGAPPRGPPNPYFPPIPEGNSGRNSPAMGGPGGPPRRFSPPGGPPRAQSPMRGPPERSFTPVGGPLQRVRTADDYGGYRAFTPEPRSMSPAPGPPRNMPPGPPPSGFPPRNGGRPPMPPGGTGPVMNGYGPRPGASGPPSRNGGGVADILDYY